MHQFQVFGSDPAGPARRLIDTRWNRMNHSSLQKQDDKKRDFFFCWRAQLNVLNRFRLQMKDTSPHTNIPTLYIQAWMCVLILLILRNVLFPDVNYFLYSLLVLGLGFVFFLRSLVPVKRNLNATATIFCSLHLCAKKLGKTRSMKKWCFQFDVKILTWPAQTPDLNPIQHLWDGPDLITQHGRLTNVSEWEQSGKAESGSETGGCYSSRIMISF